MHPATQTKSEMDAYKIADAWIVRVRRAYKAPICGDIAYQMLLEMGPKLDKDLVREFRFASALRLEETV